MIQVPRELETVFMRPLLPQSSHLARSCLVWRPKQCWCKQKLHNRPSHSHFNSQIHTTAALQTGVDISSTLQQPVNSLLEQLSRLSLPTSASSSKHNSRSSSKPQATSLWHGVNLERLTDAQQGSLQETDQAACQALSVHSIDQLQVLRGSLSSLTVCSTFCSCIEYIKP